MAAAREMAEIREVKEARHRAMTQAKIMREQRVAVEASKTEEQKETEAIQRELENRIKDIIKSAQHSGIRRKQKKALIEKSKLGDVHRVDRRAHFEQIPVEDRRPIGFCGIEDGGIVERYPLHPDWDYQIDPSSVKPLPHTDYTMDRFGPAPLPASLPDPVSTFYAVPLSSTPAQLKNNWDTHLLSVTRQLNHFRDVAFLRDSKLAVQYQHLLHLEAAAKTTRLQFMSDSNYSNYHRMEAESSLAVEMAYMQAELRRDRGRMEPELEKQIASVMEEYKNPRV
jgi:hypothetical protein